MSCGRGREGEARISVALRFNPFYDRLGETVKARAELAQLRERMPDATISGSFIRFTDPAATALFAAGLRAAGLPE